MYHKKVHLPELCAASSYIWTEYNKINVAELWMT